MTGPPRYTLVGTTVDGLTPYDRARRNHMLGRWLIAKTAITIRHPCACWLGRPCNPKFCPCAGRPDFDGMPAHCCSHPPRDPAPDADVAAPEEPGDT